MTIKYLSVEQAGQRIGAPTQSIHTRIASGAIPAIKRTHEGMRRLVIREDVLLKLYPQPAAEMEVTVVPIVLPRSLDEMIKAWSWNCSATEAARELIDSPYELYAMIQIMDEDQGWRYHDIRAICEEHKRLTQ